jgi:hypothetical protein
MSLTSTQFISQLQPNGEFLPCGMAPVLIIGLILSAASSGALLGDGLSVFADASNFFSSSVSP